MVIISYRSKSKGGMRKEFVKSLDSLRKKCIQLRSELVARKIEITGVSYDYKEEFDILMTYEIIESASYDK